MLGSLSYWKLWSKYAFGCEHLKYGCGSWGQRYLKHSSWGCGCRKVENAIGIRGLWKVYRSCRTLQVITVELCLMCLSSPWCVKIVLFLLVLPCRIVVVVVVVQRHFAVVIVLLLEEKSRQILLKNWWEPSWYSDRHFRILAWRKACISGCRSGWNHGTHLELGFLCLELCAVACGFCNNCG